MFNAIEFCDDNNIDYATSGKHHRQGWTNITCPFCDAPGASYHLGIEHDNGYGNCYKCGYHSLYDTILKITKRTSKACLDIIKKYNTDTGHTRQPETIKSTVSEVIFPGETKNLTQKAKEYLISRKYNPNELSKKWGLVSTPHWGFYKHRILAPIYQNSKLVSFQTRDITNKHQNKYLPCFQDEEIIQHQKCIYGIDMVSDTCVIVEGISDVWRLGYGSVATFGISYTKQQARLIANKFKRVFIMFDGEPQAQEMGDELGFLISSAFHNNVEVVNLPILIDGLDPGDFEQDDANALMKDLGL